MMIGIILIIEIKGIEMTKITTAPKTTEDIIMKKTGKFYKSKRFYFLGITMMIKTIGTEAEISITETIETDQIPEDIKDIGITMTIDLEAENNIINLEEITTGLTTEMMINTTQDMKANRTGITLIIHTIKARKISDLQFIRDNIIMEDQGILIP